MSSRAKLKACPFCGGEANLLIVGQRPNGEEEWYVGCENVNCSLHPHSTIPYASAEIAAAAWNRRADNTRSAPVGDMAAMREALVAVKKSIDGIGASSLDCDPAILMASLTQVCARLSARIERALAKPPRQCDVGTPNEQADRHRELCLKHGGCSTCPRNRDEWSYKDCILDWAQTPYESKVKK